MVDKNDFLSGFQEIKLPQSAKLFFELKEKFNLPEVYIDEIINKLKKDNSESKAMRDYVEFKIKEELYACSSCALSLSDSCTKKVPGEGALNSPLVFIGEGPGLDEDKIGRPFVGRAGQLLTTILDKMNINRKKVYITNMIKCRPPQNRTPNMTEIKACLHNIELELSFIAPKVIITLGAVPLKYFKPNGSIMRSRGEWINHNGIWVMPTFHPAFILRQHGRSLVKVKWQVWEDFNKAFNKAKELCPEYDFN